MSITDLSEDVRDPVEQFLLAIADDDFIRGHRLSDWIAIAPTMEEDNALASIVQDEFGHARLWYEYVAAGRDGDLDSLAHNRPADERLNTTLVEVEHADFADTVVRNFLYDQASRLLLESLRDGSVEELASRAEQALNEEPYHREHADLWLARLSATEEGKQRLERAFEAALPRAADIFEFDAEVIDALLSADVLAEDTAELADDWRATVRERIDELPISVSDDAVESLDASPEQNGRDGEHTDDLAALIDSAHPDNLVGPHPVAQAEL